MFQVCCRFGTWRPVRMLIQSKWDTSKLLPLTPTLFTSTTSIASSKYLRAAIQLKMAHQPISRIATRILSSSFRRPSCITSRARSFRTTWRPPTFWQHIRTPLLLFTLPAPRSFQSSSRQHGILPDRISPTAEAEEGHKVTQRTEISIEEYHKLSDYFLEGLLRELEQRQEEKGDLDAEYSV
jgi:hypothetical protein